MRIRVKVCPRCEIKNDPNAKFCNRCSMPLNMTAAVEVEKDRLEADQVMTRLLEDADVKNLLLQKLRQLS